LDVNVFLTLATSLDEIKAQEKSPAFLPGLDVLQKA
jgi:hypothetical protein